MEVNRPTHSPRTRSWHVVVQIRIQRNPISQLRPEQQRHAMKEVVYVHKTIASCIYAARARLALHARSPMCAHTEKTMPLLHMRCNSTRTKFNLIKSLQSIYVLTSLLILLQADLIRVHRWEGRPPPETSHRLPKKLIDWKASLFLVQRHTKVISVIRRDLGLVPAVLYQCLGHRGNGRLNPHFASGATTRNTLNPDIETSR